ncbi:uncharacterized protein LOC121201764 [Betta splendens]|uniref:Uncharacterized protein LOC121201764 n=1 Tax=Betta splendens TaxID=158456 RepID=A0A8M1H687_BETSP|nr:uncharacterized protein LOC121201764 [Betta splendens]
MEGRLILLVLMAFVTPGMAQGNNTWSGCGASHLCVTSPSGCSPQNQTCLFASVANVSMDNTTTLSFTLSGTSSGSITLQLSEPSMNSVANFTCGHNTSNNNTVSFTSTLTKMIMINYQGSVTGDFINCTFNFTFANISSIFNTSDLDLFNASVSSSPLSPTTPPTAANPTVNGTVAANPTVNGTVATNPTVNGTVATNPTVNGTVAANPTVNGTVATNPTVNGTVATNPTVNGTVATNTTVNGTVATNTTTTTTLVPTTKKPTGASVALHPYAFLLLLSLVSLCILQKV